MSQIRQAIRFSAEEAKGPLAPPPETEVTPLVSIGYLDGDDVAEDTFIWGHILTVIEPDHRIVSDPDCGPDGMFVHSEKCIKAPDERLSDIRLYGLS